MKVKKLLRFYFSAESLERAFDNIILKNACDYTNDCAERICGLIGEKQELSRLWNYIDGVMANLTDKDRLSLEAYALMRCGVKKLCEDKRKELRRAAVKFSRKAWRIESFGEALGLVKKYYCLLSGG